MSEYNSSHPAFDKVKLKNITLNGRILQSATESCYSTADGHVTDREIEMYTDFASHPLGMIISGHTSISKNGKSGLYQNTLWDDSREDEYKKITEAVHNTSKSAKIILQIGHGGAKAGLRAEGCPLITPDTANSEQIKEIINEFVSAAVIAKRCGYDGVQIHAAHGYLLSDWFYPARNHRSDAYGGSAENRFRIIGEIIEVIKSACGDSFPVFMKINCTDENISDEYFSDLCRAVNIAASLGLEAVELSGYHANPAGIPKAPYFLDTAVKLRDKTDLPIILVGGIRTVEDIDNILSHGIEMVSVCRPFICQRDFIERIFSGEKAKCINCNKCFSIYDEVSFKRCAFE